MKPRIPPEIVGPYATRIAGHWRSHSRRDAAIRWAWPARDQRDTRVLRCVLGDWEDVALPAECPPRNGGPSGSSGRHVTRRVSVPIGDGWEDAADEDGVTLATWISGAAAHRLSKRNPAR
jgi:hypothetical protein